MIGRYCVKAVALVVGVPLMFVIGPTAAGRLIESIDKRTDAPNDVAVRKRGEAALAVLRLRMSTAGYEDLRMKHDLRAGRILPEWVVANEYMANSAPSSPPSVARRSRPVPGRSSP